jgi:hypothetical protein
MTTTTPMGGSTLDAEGIAWVIANHGADHVRTCSRCERLFFSAKLQSEHCWGCWYEIYMEDASKVYEDVLTALRNAEIPASITQTGGMCLAITFPYRDGYFLLTDQDDVLSYERDEDDGWNLGYYDSEGDDVPLLGANTDWGGLQDEKKNADTAVALAMRGINAANQIQRTS